MAKPHNLPPPIARAPRAVAYATAALAGGALLVVEVFGAKLLAPYVGTSHFVWTAQITVTLLAVSAGCYAGGRWADRCGAVVPLYGALLAAAAYIGVATAFAEPVAHACLGLPLPLGSLLLCALLFFVPLSLLSMAGPFLMRSLATSVGDLGRNLGGISAVSTLGGVSGVLLVGHLLVPRLPNALTLLLTAGVLALGSGTCCLAWGGRAVVKLSTVAVLGLLAACGWVTQSRGLIQGRNVREIYRGNSSFGQLQVLESIHRPRRALLNDYLLQGAYDTQSRMSVHMFSYMLDHLLRAYAAGPVDALCIGLGVGLVPRQLALEGTQVDVVEINPAMVPLARDYFGFRPELVNLTVGDGRRFLAEGRRQYDAIVLDAFSGDNLPSHLMTREAFTQMRTRLRPEGVLVINVLGDLTPGRDFLATSLHKTLGSVFPRVRLHADHATNNVANFFFVAGGPGLAIRRTPTFDDVHPACRAAVESSFARVVDVDPTPGRVLTDDFNPVEFHDASNRERFRRDLVSYTREM